jgi:predicted DNA-binding transcriptional regulator AlpA
MQHPRVALLLDAVKRMTGLGRTQLKEAIKRGEFPKPFKALPNGRPDLWWQDEVAEHLEAMAAQRDGAAAPATAAAAANVQEKRRAGPRRKAAPRPEPIATTERRTKVGRAVESRRVV